MTEALRTIIEFGFREVGLNRIQAVVMPVNVVADMEANEETVPEPIALRHYSGKFTVRIPPELHRRLALEAAESGISLNRLVSAKLSHKGEGARHDTTTGRSPHAC
jgi:hypothetical protein